MKRLSLLVLFCALAAQADTARSFDLRAFGGFAYADNRPDLMGTLGVNFDLHVVEHLAAGLWFSVSLDSDVMSTAVAFHPKYTTQFGALLFGVGPLIGARALESRTLPVATQTDFLMGVAACLEIPVLDKMSVGILPAYLHGFGTSKENYLQVNATLGLGF